MKTHNLTIKCWDNSDKPREKLLTKGVHTLSNAELIAILIGSGSMDLSAVDLSKYILCECQNNLNMLASLELNDLLKFKGIGKAKALSIIAAFELGKRKRETEVINKHSLKSSKDIFEVMQTTLSHLTTEEFWAIYLNNNLNLIDKKLIGKGGISETSVDARIIFNHAIQLKATRIILCHNHPSGNMEPSREDLIITEKLCHGAATLSLKIIDHIIIYQEKFYSFADQGFI